MNTQPDPIITALGRYFAGEGEFSTFNKRADPLTRVRAVFLPYFDTLSDSEQQRVVRLLADIAVRRDTRFAEHRGEALNVLSCFTLPWPMDRRPLLLGAKTQLMGEFSAEANLSLWATWEEDSAAVEWGDGPAYAMTLYAILLAVATDDELCRPVEYLLQHVQCPTFRKQLSRLPNYRNGIRLSSPRQLSREEYGEHFLTEQRNYLRRGRPKPGG